MYCTLYRELFDLLEEEVEYLTGDLAKVKVFGKVYNIPRKQAGEFISPVLL